MTDRWGRGVGALVVLGAVWVLVYWWWEPSRPGISFDGDGPGEVAGVVTPVGAPPGLGPREVAVVPPRFRSYLVKDGETWESIAQKELGSAALVVRLRESNPLASELRAGREIRVPLDPENIQGRPVAGAPAPRAPGDGTVEYTIKSGDTLGGIARAYYGSALYKDLIFQANRDRLRSEDQLRLGDRLRLPPKPR
ncbi:MAG: LysM peptidoglycan-binding domain-containing protein [Phycisphaerales bacterium]